MKEIPSNEGVKKGPVPPPPPKKFLFYRYWLVWCKNGCR